MDRGPSLRKTVGSRNSVPESGLYPVAFRPVVRLGYTESTSVPSLRKGSVLVMIIPLHIVFARIISCRMMPAI